MFSEEFATSREIDHVEECQTFSTDCRSKPPSVAKILNNLLRTEQISGIVWPEKPMAEFVDSRFHRQAYFLSTREKGKENFQFSEKISFSTIGFPSRLSGGKPEQADGLAT